MMEPTETESKETLDAFAAAIEQIITEDPEKRTWPALPGRRRGLMT